jgi:hypothetical protein
LIYENDSQDSINNVLRILNNHFLNVPLRDDQMRKILKVSSIDPLMEYSIKISPYGDLREEKTFIKQI